MNPLINTLSDITLLLSVLRDFRKLFKYVFIKLLIIMMSDNKSTLDVKLFKVKRLGDGDIWSIDCSFFSKRPQEEDYLNLSESEKLKIGDEVYIGSYKWKILESPYNN